MNGLVITAQGHLGISQTPLLIFLEGGTLHNILELIISVIIALFPIHNNVVAGADPTKAYNGRVYEGISTLKHCISDRYL